MRTEEIKIIKHLQWAYYSLEVGLARTICMVYMRYFRQGNHQIYGQVSHSPPQKGGIDAPFLNCTSEVTQRFLYINVTLLHKINKFGVKGESGGLDLCHFPAKKVAWVYKRGFWSEFHQLFCPDRFRVKPYPSKKKRGVEICR